MAAHRRSWDNHGETWVRKWSVTCRVLCEELLYLEGPLGTHDPVGMFFRELVSGRHVRSAGAIVLRADVLSLDAA